MKHVANRRRSVSSRAFIALLALVLVIGCVAGGTVAWLVATTDTVTNTFTYGKINIALAEEALKDIISPNAERKVTPELIIQVVADHFGITPLDISSQKRNKEVVYPRQIVMYLCQSMTGASLQEIGRYLGGRDHTTIIHGREKIAADLKTNENLANTIEILKKKLSPQ